VFEFLCFGRARNRVETKSARIKPGEDCRQPTRTVCNFRIINKTHSHIENTYTPCRHTYVPASTSQRALKYWQSTQKASSERPINIYNYLQMLLPATTTATTTTTTTIIITFAFAFTFNIYIYI